MGKDASSNRTSFLRIEKGPERSSSEPSPWKNVRFSSTVAGCVPVFILFLTVGPVLVTSLDKAGLSEAEITGYMMAIHILGGLNGLVLALYYRQPILGAYSIPGIAIVANALASVSYMEAIGGFIVAGVLVLIVGLTGVAKTIVRYIPSPIMAAMIAGILLSFPMQIIDGLKIDLAVGIPTVAGYVVFHRWVPRLPGIMGALLAGVIAAVVLGRFQNVPINWAVGTPNLQVPEFSLVAIVSVSIPLAIAVIGSENMQAIGVLRTIGFRPPVTAMTVISGIGGVLAGIFGGQNANIAGPATAAVSSPESGPVRSRYCVAVIAGIIVIAFGVFAPVVRQIFEIFPEALLLILVGLVLIPIVGSAFKDAWRGGRFSLSVIIAFVIAASEVSPLGISSAFWALLIGCATALFMERKDFKEYLSAIDSKGEEYSTQEADRAS